MKRKATSAQGPSRTFQTADRLHSLAIHLLRRLRRADDATGLTAPKLSALSVIVHAGPLTLGDLASAEQVRPPTMTRIVAELEFAGLITRKLDRTDRRVTRVRATKRGIVLLRAGRNKRVQLLADWLETCSRGDLQSIEQAVEILQRFRVGE
jgi:DNA-binding MarR family transcriptional regulator